MKKLKTSIQKFNWLVRCAVILFITVIISSCATSKLPAYQPTLPTVPQLEEMPDEEISEEAYRNIVKLIAYSDEQRIILEGWQSYYDNLRTVF